MKIHEIVVKKMVSAFESIPGLTYTIKYEEEIYTNVEPPKKREKLRDKFIDQISDMKPWDTRAISIDGVDLRRLQSNLCSTMNQLYGKGKSTTFVNKKEGYVEVMLHDMDLPRTKSVGFEVKRLFNDRG